MNVEAAILRRTRLRERKADEGNLARSVEFLMRDYELEEKIAREPETLEIVQQLYDRVAAAYPRLGELEGKRILDIACGSRTSKAPAGMIRMVPLVGARSMPKPGPYSSLFEPWLCRILGALGAAAVGVDRGDLDGENFEHYRVDLSSMGALDFLPGWSFDAVHDSRLFGSPEFTSRFIDRGEALNIAREIALQEERVLKVGGIILHSDAHELAGP